MHGIACLQERSDGACGPKPNDPPLVLIADDQKRLIELLRFYLERSGFTLQETYSGTDLTVVHIRQGRRACLPLPKHVDRPEIEPLVAGDLTYDLVAQRAACCGKSIHVGMTLSRLFQFFLKHPGQVFSRDQLLDAVWHSDTAIKRRTVDVYVRRLRSALEATGTGCDPIRTVRDAGYVLEPICAVRDERAAG